VELGRVDKCLEVSMMSSHLALPREGHMEQVLHIFAHLKKYHNTEVVFDPSDPVIDEAQFEAKDWDGVEELPPNMPELRGQGFVIRAKVNADHASDSATKRSRTGFLVWINSCLVYFMSKKYDHDHLDTELGIRPKGSDVKGSILFRKRRYPSDT
jgi:hypothetical protein